MKSLRSRITVELIVVLCILALGAYLRLYRIRDYLTFLGDEGRDVLIVKHIIVDHVITFLGPTASVGGFFLGPMYYYFMAPFLWAFRLDPVGPAVMVALFGIATIYLVYYVGKKFFHPIVGIFAASLYALSPVVIAYSRSSWNPNLVPFFALLLIFCLWRYAIKRHDKDLLFLGLISGLGIQFHYLFSFLIVLTVIWVIGVDRSLKAIRNIGIMIIGGCITFSPFLSFEIRHGFPNTRSLINFLHAGNETGFSPQMFFATITDVSFRSIGRLLYRLPDGSQWIKYPNWQVTVWFIGIRTTILILLVLLGLLGLMIFSKYLKKWKKPIAEYFPATHEQQVGALLLLLWFVSSVFFFGFYRRGIYDYYFGIFFPFPFLGLGVIFWQTIRSRVGLVLASSVWIGLVIFNWQGRPFIYPPNKQLDQTETIAKAAFDLTGNKPFNFALITETNSDHAYRYFFEIWGHPPITIDQPANDPDRHTVTDQLIVICENQVCQPLGNSLWEVAGFGRAQIQETKDVFPVKIFRLIHYTGK